MNAPDYDLILAGGGLANGLIAWRLAAARPELRILLLEQDDHLGGNHTWSFHASDLTAAQRAWIAPMVSWRWSGYQVVFPELSRTLDGDYCSILSDDFARVLEPALGPALRTGTRIAAVHPTRVELASGETLHARAVIDGRGPGPGTDRHLALGYQTFLGQEVRLRAPHGLAAPIIMDASVAQQGGYRFVYVLPFGPDRLLIEDTHYIDSAARDPEQLRANIRAYAQARGWQVEAVLREEHGALPIVLAGDVECFWDDLRGQPSAGLRAGLFHFTTGYSLPHAARLADAIAAMHELAAPALFEAIRAEARTEWDKQGFFRLLNRMLFLAGSPDARWRVMQKFYQLPPSLIAHFYAGRLNLADKARILSGKPPVPVLQALSAARKIHPHQIRTPA